MLILYLDLFDFYIVHILCKRHWYSLLLLVCYYTVVYIYYLTPFYPQILNCLYLPNLIKASSGSWTFSSNSYSTMMDFYYVLFCKVCIPCLWKDERCLNKEISKLLYVSAFYCFLITTVEFQCIAWITGHSSWKRIDVQTKQAALVTLHLGGSPNLSAQYAESLIE